MVQLCRLFSFTYVLINFRCLFDVEEEVPFSFHYHHCHHLQQEENQQNQHPGDSIRPVNPIVSDRIRVGLCRNPTSSIKNRSDPMGLLSILFSRNPTRI